MTHNFILKVVRIILFFFATTGSVYANPILWQFTSTVYSDSQGNLPPIAYGTLLTEGTADQDGHFKVLEITGFFGLDPIIGLANRSSRPWDQNFALPDNSVSVSPWDTGNGCGPGYNYWASVSAHFSCGGLSFKTQNGTVNLAFGGAIPFVAGYQNEWIFVHHTVTALASSVPEPNTSMLALAGLIALGWSLLIKRQRHG